MHHTRSSNRGVSLVEAMVALAVMAFGMLTVVGVQATLRLNADISKQRSEATRFAQHKIEEWRAFVAMDSVSGQTTWAAIATDASAVTVPPSQTETNTSFTVQRQVVSYADPPSKTMAVTVGWTDRSGQPQSVVLKTEITGAAPALSGALSVRPAGGNAGPMRRPLRRHSSIPTAARDFGTFSGMVPPFRSNMLILFNNVTGLITGVCTFNYDTENDNISQEEIALCDNTNTGQLLSGFVRVQRRTDGPELTAGDVEDPIGPALNIRMRLNLTSTNHPTGSFCIDDANTLTLGDGTLKFATYFCVIFSNSAGLWSGTTTIEPRFDSFVVSGDDSGSGPSAASRYRICRYTPAANDAQTVVNQDHPRNYVDVSGNLTNQNFVIIPSVKHCPTDVAADPASGNLINTNTLQHQPAPSS